MQVIIMILLQFEGKKLDDFQLHDIISDNITISPKPNTPGSVKITHKFPPKVLFSNCSCAFELIYFHL